MSYTAVTKMRSHRYPLMGLGCGCTTGMGEINSGFMLPAVVTVAVVGAAIAGVVMWRKRNRRSH